MKEALGLALTVFGALLMLLGAISVFLPRGRGVGTTTTTTMAELERVKREAERRFQEETR